MASGTLTSTLVPGQADKPMVNQEFLSTLESSSHAFLQPPPSLHSSSVRLVKRYLDPLAASTSKIQTQRQDLSRRKRKRDERDGLGFRKPLQLKEIYLDGFSIQQIWEQARRVLDASRREAETSLKGVLQEQATGDPPETVKKWGRISSSVIPEDTTKIEQGLDISDEQYADASGDESIGERGDLMEEEEYGSVSEDHEAELDGIEDEHISDGDSLQDDLGGETSPEEADIGEDGGGTFVPDKLGLNDGFFSIDDFNRQSEFLEQQDGRGENDGAASDEEEVDWDANPFAVTLSGAGTERLEKISRESSEDDGEGPTFGNADLDGQDLSDSDDDPENGVQMDDMGAMNNTNDIKYADFFAPPARKASKSSRRRALPKTQPPTSTTVPRHGTEDDIQRTISAVRRDIFDDDLTPDEDGSRKDNDPRSSHQKRQAALAAEIRRLEAAAVAKRDWTLSGEARATDRPINSLLEEDLEFERTGKPIPVITQEVSEDIEALIKRRIIAREFDEVIKRRPGNLTTGSGANIRRGRFELEDTKPQQSLAEVYEADYLKNVDPEGYSDKRDKKLKAEHAKIEQMWKDVSTRLDALSSWHYKPKPPSASINVVADVPTISMEDARPSAGGDVGGHSMLAPQEVYKAGEASNKREEVVTGSGLPVARNELTRDEKTRRRRREKERIRKAGGLVPAKDGKEVGTKMKEKQGIVGNLKRGGVRIIGKKGEIRDVEGKAVTEKGAFGRGAGGYKL